MTVRRAFLTAVVALGFLGLYALTAHADIVPVAPADWIGSRSTPGLGTPDGIVAYDGWNADRDGLLLSWNIQKVGANYLYSYALDDEEVSSRIEPGPLHFILEVSHAMNGNNVDQFIWDTHYYYTVGSGPLTEADMAFEGPHWWYADALTPGNTNSNGNGGDPNLPANIYGIKFFFGDPEEQDFHYFSFMSTQPPVWGDFYTKDGKQGGVVCTAWNSGIGVEGEGPRDFTGWIPTPDNIPEPSSLLLLVLGSSAVLGSKLRSRKK